MVMLPAILLVKELQRRLSNSQWTTFISIFLARQDTGGQKIKDVYQMTKRLQQVKTVPKVTWSVSNNLNLILASFLKVLISHASMDF